MGGAGLQQIHGIAPQDMSFVSALFALLLPATTSPRPPPGIDGPPIPFAEGLEQVPSVQQVRIEQRITIRIAPRRPATPPVVGFSLPRMSEKHAGKCVSIAAIGGVGIGGDNRLLLYLRDNRLLSASLERACRARDFYSGFYLERHNDGRLCVDRDTLLSRSGANCKVTRLRQMVPDDD